MREQIAGAVGLEVVEYRVWEVPVFEILATASTRLSASTSSRSALA